MSPPLASGAFGRYRLVHLLSTGFPMRLLAACLLSAATLLAYAGGSTSYGKPFADGPAVPVSTAIAAFEAHAGEPRRFSGRITEVCQAQGCWMMLEHDGQAARVKFGDHAFFLPKDASGTAVVHGVLERKQLTPEQAKHFSEDSGKRLPVETVEFRIVADGVRVTPGEG
ncbi:DUF4920 domain-containing protein [Aerolutibacter ruishenii]|uniref:Uncharacterized protein DUF4920 n=1 Tax=Aerolutibacter ruishenii TaxID=686800 RepID=A0A562LWH9_9GAMM|nr:DUF4920 domain-containing protein [Lysobacter ruishenii]TWI12009.1 uncharacterized protein DUF4920 [Lysobacter ruishenii]